METKKSIFLTVIFINLIITISHGQTNYSVMCNYLTDRILKIGETPDQTVCKTTFIKYKLDSFLLDHRIVKLQIQTIDLPDGNQYFVINALDSNNSVLRSLVGDYPCPETCYPPETLESNANNMFDKNDILSLLANYPNAKYVNIHSAKRQEGTNSVFSHVIYAISIDNQGEFDAHNDMYFDTMFISIFRQN